MLFHRKARLAFNESLAPQKAIDCQIFVSMRASRVKACWRMKTHNLALKLFRSSVAREFIGEALRMAPHAESERGILI